MKTTLLRVVIVALCFFAASPYVFGQGFRAPERVSVSVNATVVPSLDVGFAVSDQFSLHLKGGYLPNLFKGKSGIDTSFAHGELSLQWWQGLQRFQGFYVEMGLLGGWSDGTFPKWGITRVADRDNIHFGVEGGVGYMWRFGGLGIGVHGNIAMMAYLAGKPDSDGRQFKIHAPIPTNTGIRIAYFF